MVKRLFLKTMFLLVCILLSISSVVTAGAKKNDNDLDAFTRQELSVNYNNRILDYFKNSIILSNPKYDKENIELYYPDYYGGSFLNDNFQLVIELTNESLEIKEKLKSVSGDKALLFKPVHYSYADLVRAVCHISECQKKYEKSKERANNYNILKDLSEFWVDDKLNCVKVGIINLDDNKANLFKKQVLDFEALEFVNMDSRPQLDISNEIVSKDKPDSSTKSTTDIEYIRPGQTMVRSGNQLLNYSLGFPVYRTVETETKQYGFVTAGHLVSVGKKFFTSNLRICGTALLNRVGGKYDVSFVNLRKDVKCLNSFYNLAYLYQLCPSNSQINYPLVGRTVNKKGRDTYFSSGSITSTYAGFSASFVEDGQTYTFNYSGLVKATYSAASGDSGAVVFSSNGLGPYSNHEGIHTGRNGSSAYYCSAINIINLYYLVAY